MDLYYSHLSTVLQKYFILYTQYCIISVNSVYCVVLDIFLLLYVVSLHCMFPLCRIVCYPLPSFLLILFYSFWVFLLILALQRTRLRGGGGAEYEFVFVCVRTNAIPISLEFWLRHWMWIASISSSNTINSHSHLYCCS